MPGKGIKREHIVSLTSTDGWYAKYAQEGGTVEYARVLAWGLVEREYEDNPPKYSHERHLVGFDQDSEGLTELCDSASNFAGYIHKDDPDFNKALIISIGSAPITAGRMLLEQTGAESGEESARWKARALLAEAQLKDALNVVVLGTEKGLTPIGELIAAAEALFQVESPGWAFDESLLRVRNGLDAFKKSCGPKA